MKRILYSCFLLLSLFLVKKADAQAFTFTTTPLNFCFDGITPVNAQAAVTASQPGSTSYVYTVQAPAGCPAATFTYDPAFPDGSVINITYSCCGQYTITNQPFNGGNVVGNPLQRSGTCVPNLTVTSTATNNWACEGDQVTITANTGLNGSTYSWVPSGSTSQNITVVPTAPSSCYTVNAVTPAGCSLSAVYCLSVQTSSLLISPPSLTTCAANVSTLTATSGTNVTGLQWYDPTGIPLGTANTQTIQAPNGNPSFVYSVVATSAGNAGTCTVSATSTLNISTFISTSLTPSSLSVCPGASLTLTVSPGSATSYTILSSNAATTPSFVTTSNTPTVTGPATYSVIANYGGCPGNAAVTVSTAILTPTLTPDRATACPSTAINFIATGGAQYTYAYFDPALGMVDTLASHSTNTIAHSPGNVPANYTVYAYQGGCTGSGTLHISLAVLHPTLLVTIGNPPTIATQPASVCPSTSFVLTGTGGQNYTLTPPTGYSTTASLTGNTYSSSVPSGYFPAIYTLTADSANCKNNTTATIYSLTLHPFFTSTTPSSVCPSGPFNATPIGGNSTNFTYNFPPSVTLTPIGAAGSTANISIPAGSFPASFTISADSLGCLGTAVDTIGLLSLNSILHLKALVNSADSVGSSTPSVCPGNQFTVVATGATSYAFYAPGSLTFTSGIKGDSIFSSIPITSFAGNTTYTVAGDSLGCIGTDTIHIAELFIHPTLTITPSGSVCAGSSVTLSASSNNINMPTSYNYSYIVPPGTTTSIAGTSSLVAYPVVPTTYSVFADSSGCISVIPGTATIGINPGLSLTLTANSPTVCSGTLDTLHVNNVSGYIYTWSSSNAMPFTNLNDTTAVINPITNTTYSVHAVDPGGCVGNATITISINPTASLTTLLASVSPTAICTGSSAILSASGAVNYAWIPASGVVSPNQPVTSVTPSATTIYTITGDNGLGCFGAATTTLTLVQKPIVYAIPSSPSVCSGYNATLTAYGAVSYMWTGVTLTGNTIPPVYQQSIAVIPGTYTVSGNSGGNCVSRDTTIQIGAQGDLPIGVSASSPTTCIANNNPKYSKPVILNATGGSNYTWIPYNPAIMTYSLGPQTTVIPPASTCYTVIGYTSFCSGQATICISVIPQFTMNVVPPLPAMCIGDSLHLKIVNVGSGAVGPVSAFTYSWTEPGNAPLTLSNPLSSSVIANPLSTSTYSVEMRDSRSCVSVPRLVTVTVYPRPVTAIAIPTINSVATNTVCYVGNNPGQPDDVITLTGSNQNTGLPYGVVPTYTWIPPNDYLPNYNPILTPANNAAVTVKAPLRAPSVVVYTLESGYNGIPGCIRFDTVSVRTIDCRPITNSKILFITDRIDGDTLCARQCVTFSSLTDTAAGGPQHLFWQFPGGSPATSSDVNPTVCYNLPSASGYNVILRVDNPFPTANGGSSATSGAIRFIKVVDVPNVTIISPGGVRSDTVIRFGQSVALHGSGARSYEWYPPLNITSLTNPNVTVNPFQTTQYVLNGYNSKGCSSSDTINVIIIQDCGEMFVPNAFSPNNDGHNDILFVRGICLQTLTFMVFNRWGEKVFETADQSVGWNGDFRGEPENSGVFVYRLEGKTYDGKGFSAKGNITLIR